MMMNYKGGRNNFVGLLSCQREVGAAAVAATAPAATAAAGSNVIAPVAKQPD